MSGESFPAEPVALPPLPPITRPIALVGLMGAGKSSIGRRLADALGLPFIDADEEIEKAAGRSITDIFAAYGEAGFRDGEYRVITRLLNDTPCVLATGGGAMTHPATREALKNKAITLWLRADLKVLARRVAGKGHRPLLIGKNPIDVLKAQAKARYPFYEQADIVVDSGDQPHGRALVGVVEALKAYLETHS